MMLTKQQALRQFFGEHPDLESGTVIAFCATWDRAIQEYPIEQRDWIFAHAVLVAAIEGWFAPRKANQRAVLRHIRGMK